MDLICNGIKLFLSLFLLIYHKKLIYIYLIFLAILFYCNYYNNLLLNILFNIFLFINIFIIYVINLSSFKYNVTLITIYFIYLLKTINLIKNKFIKISLILIVLLFYLIIINFNLKYNSYISKFSITNIDKNIKNKKLKIALCISGRIDDNIKEIYNSWKKNLLNYYDVDIFMNIDKNNIFITDVIKPKKCVIFNDMIYKNNNMHKYANLMFYRIYETNKYCNEYQNKNNIKYDLIIRLRTDILLKERLYLENFNKNVIYFPMREDISNSTNIYSLGVTDQFFIANNNLMNKICNIYLVLDNFNFIKCKISEVSLLYYLNKNKIKYSHFEYKWMINYYNNNIINNFKFFNRIKWIFSKSCFINIT